MSSPRVTSRPPAWILVVLGLAAVAFGVSLWWASSDPTSRGTLGQEFEYDVEEFARPRPELLGYRATLAIETGLDEVSALAVGPGDRIYVAGADRILELASDGTPRRAFELPGAPSCLSVAPSGRLFVGMGDHVAVLDADGKPVATWGVPEEGARLVSIAIAVSEDDVYVADAGNRLVWRYDGGGELKGRLEAQALETEKPAFILPSPYFDVAFAPDGRLRVVNPGRHRIETYRPDGSLAAAWGHFSFEPEGFAGCCNPAHFAVLPDGRFVTSEKGLARVKRYDVEGRFDRIVADASTLGDDVSPRDVATDSTGRVLVLDPATRTVRVYVEEGT